MHCAGDVVDASSIPGWRRPGISYINPLAEITTEVRCAFLRCVLAILPDDEDMKPSVVGIVDKGKRAPFFDRNRRRGERVASSPNSIWVIARRVGCAATGNK